MMHHLLLAFALLSQLMFSGDVRAQADHDALETAGRIVKAAQQREELDDYFLHSESWSGRSDYGFLEFIDRTQEFQFRIINRLDEARVVFALRDDPFGDQEISLLASFLRIKGDWVFAGIRELESKAIKRWGKNASEETEKVLSDRFKSLSVAGPNSKELKPADLSTLPWFLIRQLPRLVEPEFLEPAALGHGGKYTVRRSETVIVELIGEKKRSSVRAMVLEQTGKSWLVSKATYLDRIMVQPNEPILDPNGKPFANGLADSIRKLFLSGDPMAACKQIKESPDLVLAANYLFSAYRLREPDRTGKAPIIEAIAELGEQAEPALRALITDATKFSSRETRQAARAALGKINSEANNRWPILSTTADSNRWDALYALLMIAPDFDDPDQERPTISERLGGFDDHKTWVKRLEGYLVEARLDGHEAISAIRIFGKEAARLIPAAMQFTAETDFSSAENAAATIIDLGQYDRKAAAVALTKLMQKDFDDLWDYQLPILLFLGDCGADAAVALQQLERIKTQDTADADSIAVDGRVYQQAQKAIQKIKAAQQ